MKSVVDGRIINASLSSIVKTQEDSSLLIQAIETYDEQLLDWCLDNMQPPSKLPIECIPHLLSFLSAKFWVFSDTTALLWLKKVILANHSQMKNDEECKVVLQDIRSKLNAKSATMDDMTRLRDKLRLGLLQKESIRTVDVSEQPKLTINDQ